MGLFHRRAVCVITLAPLRTTLPQRGGLSHLLAAAMQQREQLCREKNYRVTAAGSVPSIYVSK